jgi:hypothetical protein
MLTSGVRTKYYLLSINKTFRCSFDVVRDQLGLVRSEFPHTFYGVAGTQVALIFTFQNLGIAFSQKLAIVTIKS